MNQTPRIVIQQIVIPDYRMPLFLRLREHYGEDFQVIAGDEDFGSSNGTRDGVWAFFTRAGNHFLCGRRLVWQSGSIGKMVRAKVLVANMNLRNLSLWVALVARKMLWRRTIFWGHASGANATADKFRGLYLRLGEGFIAYTDSQAEYLKRRFPWLRVDAAPNACMAAADCGAVTLPPDSVDSLIFVGRLVKEKKVRLLLEAFLKARNEGLITENTRLVFVGDGPEATPLRTMAADAGAVGRVLFTGHISSPDALRPMYAAALFAVSPGYAGLSLTQSFGFGVPMLVAKGERHSPEIEACREGVNTVFFESDSEASLAAKIADMFANKDAWLGRRGSLAEWTRSHYTFEGMAEAFIRAIGDVNTEEHKERS